MAEIYGVGQTTSAVQPMQSRVPWIHFLDAVCISQNETDENNKQTPAEYVGKSMQAKVLEEQQKMHRKFADFWKQMNKLADIWEQLDDKTGAFQTAAPPTDPPQPQVPVRQTGRGPQSISQYADT
jgi:hypothetical protein